MTEKHVLDSHTFWKVSIGQMLVMIAVLGPLVAAYVNYCRMYLGLDTTDDNEMVIVLSALGSGLIGSGYLTMVAARYVKSQCGKN